MASAALLFWLAASAAGSGCADFHKQTLAKVPLYRESGVAEYVQEVGDGLLVATGRKPGSIQFHLLDDPGINAFTPGYGCVYMNRGLLSQLSSEAQLAGVLAHEIGHIDSNHLSRTRSSSLLRSLLAGVAAVYTGHNSLGQAIDVAGQTHISARQRAMELEADAVAARYLHDGGYDPQVLLEVLRLLKQNERLMRTLQMGNAYYGMFASHPRTDERLSESLEHLDRLPPGEARVGRDAMRRALDGMLYGPSIGGGVPDGFARYANRTLAMTFIYPQEWSLQVRGSRITLSDGRGDMATLEVHDAAAGESAKQRLRKDYKGDIRKVKKIGDSDAVAGARKSSGALLAAARVGPMMYVLEAAAPGANDEQLRELMATMRATRTQDFPPGVAMRIYYKRFMPGMSFAALAGNAVLGPHTEAWLRLMNGYPKGEPEPGTWIKLVRPEAAGKAASAGTPP